MVISLNKDTIHHAFNEFRSGSYDAYVQGLKILGDRLITIYPEAYTLPEKWLLLKGPKRDQLVVIQNKVCHILKTLFHQPDIAIDSDPALKNRLATIEFFTRLSVLYGGELTLRIYRCIKPTLLEKLRSGEKTLSSSQCHVFEKRLAAAQAYLIEKNETFALPESPVIEPLPQAEKRLAYWKSISSITRSREGHIGVFYPHGKALPKDLVVKAPRHPAKECFASRIFQKLGFLTPDTSIVNRTSVEGQMIEKALRSSKEFIEHCKDVPFNHFFIMSRVYGSSFSEIDAPSARRALTNDRAASKALCEQIGKIAAVDSLLHYQDRFSHMGFSNWGNLMCLKRLGRLSFAVAIDQSVDLNTTPFLSFPAKTKRVQSLVHDVFTAKTISQAAEAIWKEVPAHIQKQIHSSDALAAIQGGLIAGFKMIAKQLNSECLLQIDRELKPFYTEKDVVRVEDLLVLQQIIAKIQDC